jgi:hypothetical protein
MPRRLLHLVPEGTALPVPTPPGDLVVTYRQDGPTGEVVFESGPLAGRERLPPERVVSLLFEFDGVVGW